MSALQLHTKLACMTQWSVANVRVSKPNLSAMRGMRAKRARHASQTCKACEPCEPNMRGLRGMNNPNINANPALS